MSLDTAGVTAVDSTNQAAAIAGLPDQLPDALARVAAADLPRSASAGLVVAGMGGSAVGAALARAVIGPRERRPMVQARDYTLPPWVDEDWTVLLSSYSGSTEETLSCWDAAAAAGARRVVACTGGSLAERAAAEGVPTVRLPTGFQPRAAVGYATVVALGVAAACGVAPDTRAEVEAAVPLLRALAQAWGPDGAGDSAAKALAAAIGERTPVICGAGLTAPVAGRWKAQVNENANRHAFASELPELDHNEIEAWTRDAGHVPVFLMDPADTHPRVLRRFELTAEIVGGALTAEPLGDTRAERVLSLVLLGDLVSLYLAVAGGADPVDIPSIGRLKAALAG